MREVARTFSHYRNSRISPTEVRGEIKVREGYMMSDEATAETATMQAT